MLTESDGNEVKPESDFFGIHKLGAQFCWKQHATGIQTGFLIKQEGRSGEGGGFWRGESRQGDRTLHFKNCLAKAILIAAFVIKD